MSKSCGGACGGDATSAADIDIQALLRGARGGMGQCLCRTEDGLSIRRTNDSPSPERF
ncbi:Uncharacterised protein [Pasteurella multocida]|nr:Uncharacterised protein [Pasteurella multocida]